MRKLCPNYDREDGLETVLEVPIPEEMFSSSSCNTNNITQRSWQNVKAWMMNVPHLYSHEHNRSATTSMSPSTTALFGGKNAEIQLLLGVVGAPLIPLPIPCSHHQHNHYPINKSIKDHDPVEATMAKYIVKQYIAAVGGEKALGEIQSMYAMGKVKMCASEFCSAGGGIHLNDHKINTNINNKKKKMLKKGEVGGFVMWQKKPDVWCLELLVSGFKISAGSDGKVAWRQTPWHHSHASRGPPRPLRRFLQGLDPRSTANLFSNSVLCIMEKKINNEDCFILKVEAEASALRARSSSNVEIIRHTVWGYFSQRTGLLLQLRDSHLLRIKTPGSRNSIFWETTMESLIQDYRFIDGINIAHSGRTCVSLLRFGENSESHTSTKMEEIWAIEEVDFNIKGLSMDCFLPPADIKKQDHGCDGNDVLVTSSGSTNDAKLHLKIRTAPSLRIGASKVVAIDAEYSDDSSDEEDFY